MMASTRIRHTVPILPRVEDLERSDQWTGLACEIGNLERLSSAARPRARRSPVILENSSRGRPSYRRSMPEAPKPDLVYVRMTNSDDLRSTPRVEDDRGIADRCANPVQTEIVDRWSWKPRTDFERSYFGMENSPIVDQETTHSTMKDRSSPRGILTNRSTFDRTTKSPPESYEIGNSVTIFDRIDGKSAHYSDESYEIGNSATIFDRIDGKSAHYSAICSADSHERPRSSDFNFHSRPEVSKNQRRRTCAGASIGYENPGSTIREVSEKIESAQEVDGSFHPQPRFGSPRDSGLRDRQSKKPVDTFARRYASNDDESEYRGSRERLHEIFEHNRLLRRQFFAGMPGTDLNDRAANGADPSGMSTMRNRSDFQKSSASGFGSTETLTSQSNQSGASSTNGRKSRVEFGNSPEPIEDARLFTDGKIGTRHSDGFEISKNAVSREELDRSAFSYTHMPLPSRSVAIDRPSSRPDDGESLAHETDDRSRTIFVDRLKESPIDTSADFSTIEDSRSPIENRRRNDSIDSDHKFFATYVNVQDSSGDSSKASSPTRRRAKPIPPPLDLSTIDQRYGDRYDVERRLLKNYTVEVTPLRDYERPSRGTLTVLRNDGSVNKSAKKSAEKSVNKSVGKLAVLARTDDNAVIRGSKSLLELSANLSKSSSSGFKATGRTVSTGLSATVNDLRSPKLVNNFSNSMIDLVHSSDQEAGQRSSQRSREEEEEEEEEAKSRDEACSSPDSARRKSIGSTTPGTGTTLPLVYGPIPYKSPRRYVEGEVTIHYRSPVRQEAKEILSEEELARRSAENMRRVYQEERRRKYLQELHDIDSRRHTDNFVASQKSPISLNRYDDFVDDLSYRSRSQEQTPEPRLVARALYNFVGQSSRELTFRRGDIIFVRRQVDKNWYEGEHNAMIGLFPFNYVEILPYDGARTTPKKPYEGQARAKFNFVAQTNLELSLAKGELVVITRRVDENWYEGRIGNRKGIFPISYVEVLAEPGHRSETPVQSKPVASPAAHSLLSNGTAGGKMSMGAHHYTPSIPVNTSTTQPHYNSLPRMGGNKLHVAPVNETLHIDTHSETIPYRALYNYRPQNEDELELREGDTVYVMEKCDDGWFVGSSQRTAYFGTFPGNYVERL